MSDRKKGSIKWFNQKKNFGFIVPDDGGADVFFHGSEAEKNGLYADDLREKTKVSFELGSDRQGRSKAVNLQAA